ncbi:hypothetical protein COBT_000965 [Conglomerata obtusa]
MDKKHNIIEQRRNLKRIASKQIVKKFNCDHEGVTDYWHGGIVEGRDGLDPKSKSKYNPKVDSASKDEDDGRRKRRKICLICSKIL